MRCHFTAANRIANELIETKLLWAEAQEQIVKLKQALARAQVGVLAVGVSR